MRIRGQIAIEYLVMVGIVFAVMIPAVVIMVKNAPGEEALVSVAGDDVMAAIHEVQVTERWVTVSLFLPAGFQELRVNGSEVIFSFMTSQGRGDLVYFSKIPVVGDNVSLSLVKAGRSRIRVETNGESVLIRKV